MSATPASPSKPVGFKPAGPVYFVLGGPGSGKGTNCATLVAEFGLSHFSAGDLLRAEAKTDSDLGKMIHGLVSDGKLVPTEVTIALLCNAMAAEPNHKGYLLDGFPRKMDQAELFEQEVCAAKLVVYFALGEDEMLARIMARVAEQPAEEVRADDAEDVVRKRFLTNMEQCMPVVESYRAQGRLAEIDANASKEVVYAKVKALFTITAVM